MIQFEWQTNIHFVLPIHLGSNRFFLLPFTRLGWVFSSRPKRYPPSVTWNRSTFGESLVCRVSLWEALFVVPFFLFGGGKPFVGKPFFGKLGGGKPFFVVPIFLKGTPFFPAALFPNRNGQIGPSGPFERQSFLEYKAGRSTSGGRGLQKAKRCCWVAGKSMCL